MATTYDKTGSVATKTGSRDWDMSQWYDSKWYKFGLGLMLAVAIFWIWYQRTFAYSHGMDSMEPEFEKSLDGSMARTHGSMADICLGYLGLALEDTRY